MKPNHRFILTGSLLTAVLILFQESSEAGVRPNVALSSNLNDGTTAFDNQIVTFECTIQATGIVIVSWSGDDYVGPEGALLQVASVQNPGRTATSPVNLNTVATLVSVTTDLDTGVTEVVSSLRITASEQYPTSAVSCRLDNHGTPNTITFSVQPPNVAVTSNLNIGATAFVNQIVTFECTIQATGSIIILSWSSNDYVGPEGALLQVASVHDPGRTATSPVNLNTVATLVSVTINPDTGVTEVVSRLRITASAQYPTSAVSCRLDNHGTPNTTIFSVTPSDVTLSHNLTDDTAYENQTVTFMCIVECTSRRLAWRSDDHIGPGIAIEFTDDEVPKQKMHSTNNATLIDATTNMSTGVTVMKSVLHIVASMKFPNSSVSCESLGVITVTRFWTIPRSTIATTVGSLDDMVTTVGNSDEMLSSTGLHAAIGAVGVTAATLILVAVTIIGVYTGYRKYYSKRKARDDFIIIRQLEAAEHTQSKSKSEVVRCSSYPDVEHTSDSTPIRRPRPTPKNPVSMEIALAWNQGNRPFIMFPVWNTTTSKSVKMTNGYSNCSKEKHKVNEDTISNIV